MALGTILTIITSLAPLIPRVKNLIQQSEDTVGAGRGETKKGIVIDALIPFAKFLKDSGKLPDEIADNLDDEMVGDLVELIFHTMKGSKELREEKKEKEAQVEVVNEPPGGFKEGVAYPAHFEGALKFKFVPN